MPVPGGGVQWCSTGFGIASVPRCALGDQQCRGSGVPFFGGGVESGRPCVVAGVDVGAVLEQQGNDVAIAVIGREMERRGAGTVGGLDIGPVIEQQFHNLGMVLDDGVMQGR